MISKTIGFRGLAYFQTNPYNPFLYCGWIFTWNWIQPEVDAEEFLGDLEMMPDT